MANDLENPPELIPVQWATTLFQLIRGDLIECRNNADELMRQAERSGNETYIMCAHHVAGVVREFTGEMVDPVLAADNSMLVPKGAIVAWEKLLQTNPDYPQKDQVQMLIERAKMHGTSGNKG